jgi:hypothetical protein
MQNVLKVALRIITGGILGLFLSSLSLEVTGILENSVWLKEGVFGIIEPNTPLLLSQ